VVKAQLTMSRKSQATRDNKNNDELKLQVLEQCLKQSMVFAAWAHCWLRDPLVTANTITERRSDPR